MKDNFKYVEGVIDGNPDSEYLIICSNINTTIDPWIWKFCKHEYNYIPIWSEEFGSCNIKASDLEDAMQYANQWVNSIMEYPQNLNKTKWEDFKGFDKKEYGTSKHPIYYIVSNGRYTERLPIILYLMKVHK